MDMVRRLAGHRDIVKFDAKFWNDDRSDACAYLAKFERYRKACHIQSTTARDTFPEIFLKGNAYQQWVDCQSNVGETWAEFRLWFLKQFDRWPDIHSKETALRTFKQAIDERPRQCFIRYNTLWCQYNKEYEYALETKIDTELFVRWTTHEALDADQWPE